jgi:hypothetical protein
VLLVALQQRRPRLLRHVAAAAAAIIAAAAAAACMPAVLVTVGVRLNRAQRASALSRTARRQV